MAHFKCRFGEYENIESQEKTLQQVYTENARFSGPRAGDSDRHERTRSNIQGRLSPRMFSLSRASLLRFSRTRAITDKKTSLCAEEDVVLDTRPHKREGERCSYQCVIQSKIKQNNENLTALGSRFKDA